MPGYFTFGTTAQNGAAGALAALATSGPGGNPGGCEAAAGARDYLLGRNPFGASFVVGYGENAAEHPHHWASVFGDGLPEGAVVGGPGPRKEITDQGFNPKGSLNKGPIVYEDKRRELRDLRAGDRLLGVVGDAARRARRALLRLLSSPFRG